MTSRRCRNCTHFYDVKLHACPECGAERYGVNTALVTGALNSHLYGMAEKAEREKRFTGAR